MKRSLFIFLMVLGILVFPKIAKAETELVLAETTKYYKTITFLGTTNTYSLNNNSISTTTEITEEEYNNSNVLLRTNSSTTIETTYKKMTATITANGNYYRYKNRLVWKNIPKVRSYDIIGIGFQTSVKVKGDTHFSQTYCVVSNGCTTTTTNYPKIFTNGAGTSFKIPTGDLYQLDQTFYFDVEKNTQYTIINQTINGDYAHATSSISLANSKKYVMDLDKLELENSIVDKYDTISSAEATWSGTW